MSGSTRRSIVLISRGAGVDKARSCSFGVGVKEGSCTRTVRASDAFGNAGKTSAAKELMVT
jgi:hypothetical protein